MTQTFLPNPTRLAQLQRMDYRDYLKSPEWIRKRKEALRIAENRCQLCNTPGPGLTIHHRTYLRDGQSTIGREKLSDLVALCKDCHDLADERRRLVTHKAGAR